MSKLPYFRWHPKDFDTDENVRLMSMCEVGLYVLCLNHAWINGSLPDDLKKIAKIVGQPLSQVKKSWNSVSKCFTKNSDGALVNARLEKEREWSNERSLRAKDSVDLRWSNKSSPEGEDSEKDVLPYAGAGASESDSGSSSVSFSGSSSRVRVDFDDFMRQWSRHRGFKRPNKNLRDRAALRWQRIEIDQQKLDSAMDGFFESDWGKRENYPVLGFLKDPHSWIADEVEPEPVAAPVESSTAVVPSDPQESRIRMIVRTRPRFQKYLKLFLAAGKELTDPMMEECYSAWVKLSESEQDGAIAHAERNFPSWKLIPSPVNHLAKKPWTAIFMERIMPTPVAQMSKSEQAREIARAKGWNV